LRTSLDLLAQLIPAYQRLLAHVKAWECLGASRRTDTGSRAGRPLVGRLQADVRDPRAHSPRLLLATYFESVAEHAATLKSLPVSGIHHVVAFGFSVHQHVKAERFLARHGVAEFPCASLPGTQADRIWLSWNARAPCVSRALWWKRAYGRGR